MQGIHVNTSLNKKEINTVNTGQYYERERKLRLNCENFTSMKRVSQGCLHKCESIVYLHIRKSFVSLMRVLRNNLQLIWENQIWRAITKFEFVLCRPSHSHIKYHQRQRNGKIRNSNFALHSRYGQGLRNVEYINRGSKYSRAKVFFLLKYFITTKWNGK